MQMAGGGLVPLSKAICCRPCLPSELPIPSPPPPPPSVAAPQPSTAGGNLLDHPLSKITNPSIEVHSTKGSEGREGASGALQSDVIVKGGGEGGGGGRGGNPLLPLAIISIGCHPSSGRSFKALQCEEDGSSFVTGGCGRWCEKQT